MTLVNLVNLIKHLRRSFVVYVFLKLATDHLDTVSASNCEGVILSDIFTFSIEFIYEDTFDLLEMDSIGT